MSEKINLNHNKICCISIEELKNCTVTELIKDRLYFVSSKSEKPKETDEVHFFTVSEDKTETLNLSVIAKILKKINLVVSSTEFTSKVLVCWVTGSEKRRRTVAVCLGVFAMVYLNKDCTQLCESLGQHSKISVSEPLTAVKRALNKNFINFHDFNEDFYDSLADVRLHWIVPYKILGFYGPLSSSKKNYLIPSQYLKYFKQVGVKTIVRVKHMKYDANPFVDSGLAHYDLDMIETVPSDRALTCFLECCESEPDCVVAVHCREFLGRVGCLAAAYLIKHNIMGANKAIGWIRVCTADCFFKSQKIWLRKKEKWLKEAGVVYRNEINEYRRVPLGQSLGICSYTQLGCAHSNFRSLQYNTHVDEKYNKEKTLDSVKHF